MAHNLPLITLQGIGATSTFENPKVVEKSDVVIIAVKPTVVQTVLKEAQSQIQKDRHLFISVAMGVPLKQLEQVRKLNNNNYF